MSQSTDGNFREVCDSLGFGLVTVDRDLRVRYWNRPATQHLGFASEDLTGRSVLEVIPEQHRADARRLFESTIETKVSGEMEIKFDQEEGNRITLVVIVSPIVDASGACIGASASLRDISERKRLSKELGKARRLGSLGNMAAGVAHNFNNILGGMLTSIDYVLPSDSPRELRRTLRLLAQEIGRATRITKQLEAFAECEHETPAWAELNTLIRDFVDRLRARAEKDRINLVAELAEVTSVPYEAHRLLPVLESLTHNAFDAMSAGGTLTIRLISEAEWARITVADTGCGIPEDELEHLFEPFFTTKGEFGGGGSDNIGLGLAAVHGLVAEMGGTITLESKVGVGTTAELCLPLRREPREENDPVEGPDAIAGPAR